MRMESVAHRGYSRRARLTCVAALLGVAASGCSGPSEPLDVGTQTLSLSLLLGKIKAVQEAPIGPISSPPAPETQPYNGVIGGEGPAAPPPPPPPPLDDGPPPDCPMYEPGTPIDLSVGAVIAGPPKKATYEYDSVVVESYPGVKPTPLPRVSSWSVDPGPVDQATGAFDVTYTVKQGESTTKRVFRILTKNLATGPDGAPLDPNPNLIVQKINDLPLSIPPLPTNLPNLAGYGLAGIYLVSQESNGVKFEPTVPMALMQLRQARARNEQEQRSTAIVSVGYDPVAQAAMAFTSTVVANPYDFNACGTRLQALQVEFSTPFPPGTVPSASLLDSNAALFARKAASSDATNPKFDLLLFRQKIAFGLQYGGLVLADDSGVMLPNGVQVSGESDPPGTPGGISEEELMSTYAEWVLKSAIWNTKIFSIAEKPKR